MLRSAMLRDRPRVLQLAVRGVPKTHREGQWRACRGLAHRRNQDGGVDPTAQEGAQRHIAGQLSLDRCGESVAQPFGDLLRRCAQCVYGIIR